MLCIKPNTQIHYENVTLRKTQTSKETKTKPRITQKKKHKPQKQKSNNIHSISKQMEFQKNKTNLDGLKQKIKNKFFGNLVIFTLLDYHKHSNVFFFLW